MNTLWELLTRHWLSVILLLGAVVSIYYVYKNKEKLFFGRDNDK
jgi:hypothetical protein